MLCPADGRRLVDYPRHVPVNSDGINLLDCIMFFVKNANFTISPKAYILG